MDDDNECSSNIFNQNAADIHQWKNLKVEFLEKANGKMAIFKVFKHEGRYYVFGGSKNVHVVANFSEIIESSELHYQIINRFRKDIAIREYLGNFNIIDDIVNKTIIGEYVDGQHIVYVEVPYLVYFSGPLMNIKRLLPDQSTIPTPEQLQKIRYLENTEGAVIVYTNLDTGVIFRQKHKSVWYILIRVMREGLRHFSKQTNTSVILTKVFGIFKKRSNDFLALTEDDFAKWYVILKNFILFIKQSKYDFPDLDVQKLGIGAVYHEFTETDPSKYIEGIEKDEEYQEPLEHPELIGYVQELVKSGMKVCIVMRGPTGSGKSTVVRNLKDLVGMVSFSTDDLFIVDGEYKFDASKLTDYRN